MFTTVAFFLVGNAVASGGHDCTTSGCPAVCECLEANCKATDQACHADPACEEAEECAMMCACGDVQCALTCASNSPSAATSAFLSCYQSKCMSAADVKVASSDHDCTTSGCPAVCECLEANCEATDQACHADPACEEAEECAMMCACGDAKCALTCASNSPSDATSAFLSCYQSKCMSAADVKVASSDHDCTTSGCPAVCECLEANCKATDQACHADPACEEAEECAMMCACGDVQCALTCASNSPSAATSAFLSCYQSKCMSSFSVV